MTHRRSGQTAGERRTGGGRAPREQPRHAQPPHGRPPQSPDPDEAGPWPWPRTGTEPLTSRSATRVRLILSAVFTPLFLAATALFWYWTVHTGPGDVPGADSLRTLTVVCGALALFAVVDLVVVLRRRRRAPPRPAAPSQTGRRPDDGPR